MTYRPFPDVDRARRQLARHARPVPLSPARARLAEGAHAALETAGRALRPMIEGMREGAANVRPPRMPKIRAQQPG